MKTILLFAVLMVGCGTVETTPPEQFGQCEVHVRKLFGNVNGCWRITSRQGFKEANGTYMCSDTPTCEMLPGDPQDYVSGDVAWVGDVKCDNSCKP